MTRARIRNLVRVRGGPWGVMANRAAGSEEPVGQPPMQRTAGDRRWGAGGGQWVAGGGQREASGRASGQATLVDKGDPSENLTFGGAAIYLYIYIYIYLYSLIERAQTV